MNTLMFFFIQCNPAQTVKCFRANDMHQLLLAASSRERYFDLAELCGGEGRTSVLSIRMNLKSGENFDIVTGFNLNIPIDQRNVRKYFTEYTVLVAVMAPRCTPFGPMGQTNERLYPDGWARSYNESAPHGKFCGETIDYDKRFCRPQLCEGCGTTECRKCMWSSFGRRGGYGNDSSCLCLDCQDEYGGAGGGGYGMMGGGAC